MSSKSSLWETVTTYGKTQSTLKTELSIEEAPYPKGCGIGWEPFVGGLLVADNTVTNWTKWRRCKL